MMKFMHAPLFWTAIFAGILATVLLGATAPTLKLFDRAGHQEFHLDFEKGYGFACIEFESLTQKDYKPSKCLNFDADRTEFIADWQMVNCTMDDIGRDYPTCPDHESWNVRGYVMLAGANDTKVYSNTIRVKYQ
jgi:hypothetical protein